MNIEEKTVEALECLSKSFMETNRRIKVLETLLTSTIRQNEVLVDMLKSKEGNVVRMRRT